MSSPHFRFRSAFTEPSLWLLVTVNVLTIWIALKDHWSAPRVMWVYLFQGLIIGFFHFLRVLQLKRFVTGGMTANGRPIPPTQAAKRQVAFFFFTHYSFFNIMGALIIHRLYGGLDALGQDGLLAILGTVGFFFANHLFSYFYNRPQETAVQNLGAISFYPYIRILPMYATMSLATIGFLAFPVFLVTKTVADALTHIVEHYLFRRGVER